MGKTNGVSGLSSGFLAGKGMLALGH